MCLDGQGEGGQRLRHDPPAAIRSCAGAVRHESLLGRPALWRRGLLRPLGGGDLCELIALLASGEQAWKRLQIARMHTSRDEQYLASFAADCLWDLHRAIQRNRKRNKQARPSTENSNSALQLVAVLCQAEPVALVSGSNPACATER